MLSKKVTNQHVLNECTDILGKGYRVATLSNSYGRTYGPE